YSAPTACDLSLTAAIWRLPSFITNAMYEPSQTCTPIGAKIPRQCTIENCASLQRRTHFRSQTFHRYLTTYGPGQHPASARQTAKFNAKSYVLNILPITTVLSST